MENKNDKNNKVTVIDLNELVDQAITSDKLNKEVIEQILNIDEDRITPVNSILEEQGVDLEKDISIIDGEKTILGANKQIKILDDNDQHKLTINSEVINEIVNSETVEDIKNENIILVDDSKIDQEVNDSLKSQQVIEKDTLKKNEFKKVKILILLLGIFFFITLLLLAFYSGEISKFIAIIEQKFKGTMGSSASEKLASFIAGFISFTLKFIILLASYFIVRWIIIIILNSYEKKQIKKEMLGLRSKRTSAKLRLNAFKTNVGDVKTRIKSARKGVLIFIKVIFFIIFIIILIEPWYKDLTTLFASAGIVTVIITMGAHTILGDYFSGFLFIFEDHYNVGEVVQIGEVKGRIISANLKKICIESFSGERHFFLHSQIKHIINYSKGDNKATVIVEVAYETDVRFAIKVLQEQLAVKWTENPHIRSAPVVLGVHSFNQSGVAIRLYALVEKETQWEIERWLRLKIFEIFKNHNIEIPYPKMVVYQANKSK